jgi:hypothetical protein
MACLLRGPVGCKRVSCVAVAPFMQGLVARLDFVLNDWWEGGRATCSLADISLAPLADVAINVARVSGIRPNCRSALLQSLGGVDLGFV